MDNFTFDNDDILMKYLDNEMSGEERNAFEKTVSENRQLADRLESLKLSREAVYQYGLKEQVRAIHQELAAENKLQTGGKTVAMGSLRRLTRFSLSAAAVLLVAWFSFKAFMYFTVTPEKVYAQQFSHYELPVMRGGNEANPSELETAYRAKNYKQVADMCGRLEQAASSDHFLCGMAFMETKNYPAAINNFLQVLEVDRQQNSSRYRDEAEYNLGLSYLAAGEYGKSLSLFTKIKNDDAHLYHQKVDEKLLNRIKKFIK